MRWGGKGYWKRLAKELIYTYMPSPWTQTTIWEKPGLRSWVEGDKRGKIRHICNSDNNFKRINNKQTISLLRTTHVPLRRSQILRHVQVILSNIVCILNLLKPKSSLFLALDRKRIKGGKWGWLELGARGGGKWRQLYLNNNKFFF